MRATLEGTRVEDEGFGGTVSGFARPGSLLRVEGAALLALSVVLYWLNGESWVLFGLLLLAPDVSMLGYLAGKRVGAAAYNLFHAYPLPAVVAGFGLMAGSSLMVSVALIWFGHIGMDRLVGYGLKYASGFKDTHLERV